MEFMSSLQNGLDDQKPSLFEILSENQLAGLIPPVLRYLLTLATQRRPRYLLRVFNSFDELHALSMLAIERYFLKNYGGSFTENFYGLKRERVLRIKGGDAPRARIASPALLRDALQLREIDVWKNLAVMVGIPYLKRKLDESYNVHVLQATIIGPNYHRDQTLPADASIRQKFMFYYKWFLRKVYPSVNAAYYFAILAFNLAYLFDNTKYSSPFLWLIGTRIRRMGAADYQAIAVAAEKRNSSTPPRRRPTSSIFHPANLGSTVYQQTFSSLRLLLPASIFALKFLEWWHASDFARQLSKKVTEGVDLPPPVISGLSNSRSKPPAEAKTPQSDSPSKPKPNPPISTLTSLPIFTVSAPTPATASLCPICLHPIQTPTSAQTGYVFCYTCIFKWVEGSHERQEKFMRGDNSQDGAWGGDVEQNDTSKVTNDDNNENAKESVNDATRKDSNVGGNREGKWESGQGRCAVTGRRVLGGTTGLRRVMV